MLVRSLDDRGTAHAKHEDNTCILIMLTSKDKLYIPMNRSNRLVDLAT